MVVNIIIAQRPKTRRWDTWHIYSTSCHNIPDPIPINTQSIHRLNLWNYVLNPVLIFKGYISQKSAQKWLSHTNSEGYIFAINLF